MIENKNTTYQKTWNFDTTEILGFLLSSLNPLETGKW